jgi:hypothetical protein
MPAAKILNRRTSALSGSVEVVGSTRATENLIIEVALSYYSIYRSAIYVKCR